MAKDKCISALLAALEVLRETCNGEEGTYKPLGNDLIVYVPHQELRAIEARAGKPINEIDQGTSEWEKALEVCVRESIWADRLARKMLGPDAPPEAIERLKRRLCEELLS